jgi:murein DD-endopeptidase MepM/ murein hydrolase activator NlpD
MTIYEFLRTTRGASYKADQVKPHSWLATMPQIETTGNRIHGRSRVHGDIEPAMQDRVIDLLIEISTRYNMAYRDIAHILLITKVESGFNPDAAAGTTSAAGLGQYTTATITEAAKPSISKKRLGFKLDLSGTNVLDAERGAFGILLSYIICRDRATKYFPDSIENNIYLFHHEGWYFDPTKVTEPDRIEDIRKIIKSKISPNLDVVEKFLSSKTDVQFSLKTSDNHPYTNQPFLMLTPPIEKLTSKPSVVQGQKNTEVRIGATDSEGRTPITSINGVGEVVFCLLNKNYKKIINQFPGRGIDSEIKKPPSTPIKLDIDVMFRKPSIEWLTSAIAPHINAHNFEAAAAVLEHHRSHIALPTGNVAHGKTVPHNHISIVGSKSKDMITASKKTASNNHQTNEEATKKTVTKPAPAPGPTIAGLLYPLEIKATADYHKGARRFGSNRAQGRKHAGIDLYAPAGTVVRAMKNGTIINVYEFYAKTYAIEIDHGSFIARYGEVDPKSVTVDIGDEVNRGDTLAKVGHLVGISVPSNMLHLEMYSTTEDPKKSPLTQKTRPPYQRRADVFNPAQSIDVAAFK